VSDLAKSLHFYTGLFGMQEIDFKDGTLVFLTTPGRGDLLALNPGGDWGYPGGCAQESPREEPLAGVQGGVAHFGYMLHLLYAPLLTPVASPNLLLYQSLPTSIQHRHANARRRKDDTCVGTAARGIVA
jgi:catechol 2,3-dioxygenase-like lactoylglutathione lyase family enzyme